VHNDTVTIYDTEIPVTCGSAFKFEISKSNDTLYVMERDTSTRLATCDCVANLSFSVTGLSAGHYIASVYRNVLDRTPDIRRTDFVGTLSFDIGPSMNPFSIIVHNNQCGGTYPRSVKDNGMQPDHMMLIANYPNPFNPTTTILFHLPGRSRVELGIYDISGRKIAVLLNDSEDAGWHRVQWDAINQPSGTYFCRLLSDQYVETKKLVLLR
jgi:hypothetical protein